MGPRRGPDAGRATRRLVRSGRIVRYADANVNLVHVVGPHNGRGARPSTCRDALSVVEGRSAPKKTWANQARALLRYQGQSPEALTSSE